MVKVPNLFLFYLAPEFTMLAFTSALEALRLANQVLGKPAYSWAIVSSNGDPVSASCGLKISADLSVSAARKLVYDPRCVDMVVVCSGRNVQAHTDRSLEAWLRESRNKRIPIGAVCTGSHLLAHAGLLKDKRCTIHWENYPAFTETFADIQLSSHIYEVDDGIFTCAGGITSLDMMLFIVAKEYGPDIAREICEQAIIGGIRHRSEQQRLPFTLLQDVKNEIVRNVIKLMQENVTEALSLEYISKKVGVSRRQIERLFRLELGVSPSRYYLRLRVRQGRALVEQTGMPIVEIAVACGFVSSSHFSKVYRELEGESPIATRRPQRMATVAASTAALAV